MKFTEQKADNSNPAVSVGVQTWSRGPIFPAVIAVVEEYDTPLSRENWAVLSILGNHDHADTLYAAYLRNFFDRPLADRLIEQRHVVHYPGGKDIPCRLYDTAVTVAQILNDQVAA